MSSEPVAPSLLASVVILLAAALPPSASAGDAELAGEWAGWGYEDGSDFPLRATIFAADGATPARVEICLPHQGAFRAQAEVVELDASHVVCARKDADGSEWRWSAKLGNGALAGELTLNGERTAKFELARCAEPTILVAKNRLAPLIGCYRATSGEVVVVSAWSWGELRIADLASGATRTLFATDDETFYTGPAEYMASPIECRVKVELDDDGDPKALAITRGDRPAQSFTRCSFVEENVDWESGDAHLLGTLVAPDDGKVHPAVILLEGSNWRTRADARLDAHAFAALGFAALMFDRRGCGSSSGDANCPFDDIAEDAAAAAEMLAERDDVDATRIGVFGRSRGGWLAPLAASKSDTIGFVLLFVGPAVSPAEQETTRRLNEMRAAGASEEQVERARRYLQLFWKCTDSDADWERYQAARKEIRDEPWFTQIDDASDTAQRGDGEFVWMKRNMRHDPIPVLENVVCPVLAFFGGSDPNVTPEQNVEPMRAALHRAGNDDVKLVVVPNADHGLAVDGPGVPMHRRKGQAPEVWPEIARWIDGLKRQP